MAETKPVKTAAAKTTTEVASAVKPETAPAFNFAQIFAKRTPEIALDLSMANRVEEGIRELLTIDRVKARAVAERLNRADLLPASGSKTAVVKPTIGSKIDRALTVVKSEKGGEDYQSARIPVPKALYGVPSKVVASYEADTIVLRFVTG